MLTAFTDSATERLLKLVIDTNVVLDWLVFRGHEVIDLQRVLKEGRVQLITHRPALDELRRVLSYPQCKLDALAQREVLQQYAAATTFATLPAGRDQDDLSLPANFPRCRDRDDDHFLALAYHMKADALVTKDKAVLRLGKRSRKFDVVILTPGQLAQRLSATSARIRRYPAT